MLPQAASEHYLAQKRLSVATLVAVRRLWAQIGPDFDAGWAKVGPRITVLMVAAQVRSAEQAATYIPTVTAEVGIDATQVARPDPRALAGLAADGRDLSSLMYEPVITAKTAVARGSSPAEALTSGGLSLDTIVLTQLADIGRLTSQFTITATPAITGYVRMLNTPSCGRCAILAGKFFRWNTGFLRHPGCDCVHIPAAEQVAGDMTTDPQAYFDSLDAAGQAKFAGSKANAQAIRDGADPAQVVNISNRRTRRTELVGPEGSVTRRAPNSGLFEYEFGGRRIQYTNEGANVLRGRYGRSAAARTGQSDQRVRREQGRYPKVGPFELSDVRRLTPRSIYELAGDDRDLAIELLSRYGYLR